MRIHWNSCELLGSHMNSKEFLAARPGDHGGTRRELHYAISRTLERRNDMNVPREQTIKSEYGSTAL